MRKCVLLAVIGVQIIMLISFVYIVKHISSEKQLLLNLSNASKLITWSCTECCEIAIEDITDYSAKEIAEKNDYYKIYRCRFFISNGSDYEISGINVYSPDGMVEMNLYPFSYGDTTYMGEHESAAGDDYAYLFTHMPTISFSEVLSGLRVCYSFDAYNAPERVYYNAYYQPYGEYSFKGVDNNS